jgi:hypothetical protein
MSTKTFVLNKWNDLFSQFIDQLDIIFNEAEIRNVKLKFNLVRKVNNTFAIKAFIENVVPHGNEIMNKNEDYFFHESSTVKITEDLDIKKYYNLSSVENRDIIWQYTQGLYILASGYK